MRAASALPCARPASAAGSGLPGRGGRFRTRPVMPRRVGRVRLGRVLRSAGGLWARPVARVPERGRLRRRGRRWSSSGHRRRCSGRRSRWRAARPRGPRSCFGQPEQPPGFPGDPGRSAATQYQRLVRAHGHRTYRATAGAQPRPTSAHELRACPLSAAYVRLAHRCDHCPSGRSSSMSSRPSAVRR